MPRDWLLPTRMSVFRSLPALMPARSVPAVLRGIRGACCPEVGRWIGLGLAKDRFGRGGRHPGCVRDRGRGPARGRWPASGSLPVSVAVASCFGTGRTIFPSRIACTRRPLPVSFSRQIGFAVDILPGILGKFLDRTRCRGESLPSPFKVA